MGIDEVPVPQMASQATAATQPIPVGDDLVPHFIDAAPEGFTLVNEGKTYTPFGTEGALYKPLAGVNWPPKAYDPESGLLYICANDRIGGAARERETSPPTMIKPGLAAVFVLPACQPAASMSPLMSGPILSPGNSNGITAVPRGRWLPPAVLLFMAAMMAVWLRWIKAMARSYGNTRLMQG